MASNTPNLGLLKKDPITDGSDTFNIKSMLNDNWDKIDAAVGEVKEELQDIDIPPASLIQAGIVQLSSATNSTSESMAATSKAIKAAYDEATAAKQAGNDRKAEVVAALVAKGVAASTSDTWAQLISKMTAIIVASGDATAADLLSGKTASNKNGSFIGTMPHLTGNRNATGVAKWPDGGLAVYPEKGYQKGGAGDGEIKASVAQLQSINPYLQPQYIVQGADIFGVAGTAKKGLDYNYVLLAKGVGTEFIDRGNIERGYGNSDVYSYSKAADGVNIKANGSGSNGDYIGLTTSVAIDLTNVNRIKFTATTDSTQYLTSIDFGISRTKHTQSTNPFDIKISNSIPYPSSLATNAYILDVTSATGLFYICCVVYSRNYAFNTLVKEIELIQTL